ncbi:MAG: single-stranded DNA-binding protein [Candidatus Saccharibacteria bacterium]|nr:single-stranded DNA-binding protein [Candidatus Saccharibacteria bacterium]
MAKSINQVILMGRLTRDPELRTTTTGKSVSNFSLAVDKVGQDAGTDFFDVVAWERLAELVQQYLTKGRRCLVQGRLSQRQWEQDGQKRSRIEIMANDVTFLDGPTANDSAATSTTAAPVSKTSEEAPIEDEIDLSDIPF